MPIYVLRALTRDYYEQKELTKVLKFLSDSIKNGVSRFSWSYLYTQDLRQLQNKS